MRQEYTFKWEWPDGQAVTANYCAGDFMIARKQEACPGRKRGKHYFKVVMDVTQWGFLEFKWVSVHQCQYCLEAWAVKGLSAYDLDIELPALSGRPAEPV